MEITTGAVALSVRDMRCGDLINIQHVRVEASQARLHVPLGTGPCRAELIVTLTVTEQELNRVLSAQGVQLARQIGIPLVAREGRDYFDAFPASPLVAQVKERLPAGRYGTGDGAWLMPLPLSDCPGWHAQPEATLQLAYGPSLTVGMVSGDPEVARQRYGRHRALAENMEGSAIAQTCLRFGKPFVECRGMSNTVGERNKRHWQMEKALAHCQAVLLNWLSAATQPAA